MLLLHIRPRQPQIYLFTRLADGDPFDRSIKKKQKELKDLVAKRKKVVGELKKAGKA